MRHERKEYEAEDLHGSFALDAAALDRLAALVQSFMPAPEWTFTLTNKSGEQFSVRDRAEISHIPLHHRSERLSFLIQCGQTTDASTTIVVFNYSPSGVQFHISDLRDNVGAARAVRSWLLGCRTWYHWLYKVSWPNLHTWWLLTLSALIVGAYLPSAAWAIRLAPVGLVLLAAAGLTVRDLLFDPMVIEFGEEKIVQETRIRARRYIFGAIITAVGLTTIAQVVQRLIPGAPH